MIDPAPSAATIASPGAPPAGDVLRARIARLKNLPTLPRLLDRVVVALEDPDVDFVRVAELIETDQSLSSQILRLANSAFYGLQGSVTSVSRALIVLGSVVTRSLVLTTGVFDLRSSRLRGFWEHSLGCAVAAGAIAKVTGRVPPEVATGAGLMHDLGKVIVQHQLPEAFEEIAARAAAEERRFAEVERDALGVDHCEIASWLLAKWSFPPSLSEPIVLHHAPSRARAAPDETAIVHVANTLVRALDFGCGGDPHIPDIEPAAWRRLELSEAALARVLDLFDSDLDHALNYALFD
jgi:HD-like signal output (HDOD) protein